MVWLKRIWWKIIQSPTAFRIQAWRHPPIGNPIARLRLPTKDLFLIETYSNAVWENKGKVISWLFWLSYHTRFKMNPNPLDKCLFGAWTSLYKIIQVYTSLIHHFFQKILILFIRWCNQTKLLHHGLGLAGLGWAGLTN